MGAQMKELFLVLLAVKCSDSEYEEQEEEEGELDREGGAGEMVSGDSEPGFCSTAVGREEDGGEDDKGA